MVHDRVFARSPPAIHHDHWIALLEPRHISVWQGDDAQGLPSELEQYGHHG